MDCMGSIFSLMTTRYSTPEMQVLVQFTHYSLKPIFVMIHKETPFKSNIVFLHIYLYHTFFLLSVFLESHIVKGLMRNSYVVMYFLPATKAL